MEAGDKDLGRRGTDCGTVFVCKENQIQRLCGEGLEVGIMTGTPCCFLVPKCGLSGVSRLPLITV